MAAASRFCLITQLKDHKQHFRLLQAVCGASVLAPNIAHTLKIACLQSLPQHTYGETRSSPRLSRLPAGRNCVGLSLLWVMAMLAEEVSCSQILPQHLPQATLLPVPLATC